MSIRKIRGIRPRDWESLSASVMTDYKVNFLRSGFRGEIKRLGLTVTEGIVYDYSRTKRRISPGATCHGNPLTLE